MKNFVDELEKIIFRNRNRSLTFDIEHLLKSMQMMKFEKYVSRSLLCQKLCLGEGSVKTIILHLKKAKYVNSIKSGTYLLDKGHCMIDEISKYVEAEIPVNHKKFLPCTFNHAVILKNISNDVVDGMQQRDFAIVAGANTALTIIVKKNQFWIPMGRDSIVVDDPDIKSLFRNHIQSGCNYVIIIVSADSSITAELAAKFSALCTISNIQTISSRNLFQTLKKS